MVNTIDINKRCHERKISRREEKEKRIIGFKTGRKAWVWNDSKHPIMNIVVCGRLISNEKVIQILYWPTFCVLVRVSDDL